MYKYSIVVQEDPSTGLSYIEIPNDIVITMGWNEGTEIEWIDNEDGTFILKEIAYD